MAVRYENNAFERIAPGFDTLSTPRERDRDPIRSVMVKTSHSHPLRIAEVETSQGCGIIGVTFCPGKCQPDASTGSWARDLDMDLDAIKTWGSAIVVTLIEPHELSTLKVEELGAGVTKRQMEWFHLPIRDFHIPSAGFEKNWASAGRELRVRLRRGEKILVHCKGGLGRAGTIAARMLIDLGVDNETAMARVRLARKDAIETPEQERYVRRLTPLSGDQVSET